MFFNGISCHVLFAFKDINSAFYLLHIFYLLPEVIGVEVAAITLQSLEGTWTPVDPADFADYFPVVLESGDICNNVVLQVCT